MNRENNQIAMTDFLALPVVTMIWCCSGRVNRMALSLDIRVIVHTEAIRNVYVSISNTAHDARVQRCGPIKLFIMFTICSGMAALMTSAIDSENNSRSAMFHGLYRYSVVMIRKCPQIKTITTTSTTSPRVGSAWNGAGVVPFRESLRKKLGDVGKCDITSKSFSVSVLTVVQKETMIVPMGAVSSAALTFKTKQNIGQNFLAWRLCFGMCLLKDRICTQCYRLTDNSGCNKWLYDSLFALIDTIIVYLPKLSRGKLNADKQLIQFGQTHY